MSSLKTLSSEPLLIVENLGRKIQERWIWQSINFSLTAGDRVAIVGASGTGKSLLLRSIAGLDTVQTGLISFSGKSLFEWSMPQYRSQVIYLHQRPALQEGTVEDNLQAVFKLAVYRDKTFDRACILTYLAALGRTPKFLERPSTTLSGGEAQIVAFLRALQLAPRVLLFDEPTASLDIEAIEQFEALVHLWHNGHPDRAYLWTSHNPAQIERISDRQLHLPQWTATTSQLATDSLPSPPP
ncbi:ATP-binding cassette domain-containing protein [Microcoleus sp. FACHB-1515]|uniref:ABC transporter ATP-binding protein n=1 Tax=Cyanophyceae TaxID=3028117 RepID=UPI001682C5B1|nr:ATP-binding cassette domain-containing protein [Microcoleus sp. FACHB-1515]MBD2091392.1 ATP-binding cassette domain-containing protein [Microcoleus sp. FACHB-1515]